MDKTTLLQSIDQLNSNDQPFAYTVNGDSIIGTWKYMDQRWFAPAAVTDEHREFSYVVVLHDDGTYSDSETHAKQENHFGTGSISFGSEKSGHIGPASNKSFSFGVGRDDNDAPEAVGVSFDSATVKKPLREFLEANGWKKRGLFKNIFG